MSTAPVCNTLWIGATLGPVERACMLSVMRQGHRMVLWCYRIPDDVPSGVEIADAAQILAETNVIFHAHGSPSLFSNWFRYELLRRGKGIWVDADLYLLKPLPDLDILMGLEDAATIGSAVLRLPQDSLMLPPLLSLFDEREVPPWLPVRSRLAGRWRRLMTGKVGLHKMPWGVAGPRALTAIARGCGLFDQALPREVFYPVHWTEAEWIFAPGERIEDRVGTATIAVHLWNERIRHAKHRTASGNFLARLHIEAAAAI